MIGSRGSIPALAGELSYSTNPAYRSNILAPVSPEMILNYIAERVLGLPRSY